MKGGYGATVARLTPDQKVGSSNLSALIFPTRVCVCVCVCVRFAPVCKARCALFLEAFPSACPPASAVDTPNGWWIVANSAAGN